MNKDTEIIISIKRVCYRFCPRKNISQWLPIINNNICNIVYFDALVSVHSALECDRSKDQLRVLDVA